MLSLHSSLCIGLCPELLYNRYDVRSNVFLDVNVCSKVFGVDFRVVSAWEKSMLSRWGFLVVDSPDCEQYSLGNVDGARNID